MKRRALLATLGTTALAGCGGQVLDEKTTQDVEAADSGPPHFEQVEISGPSEVAVGEEFHIEVTVANTGGRAGDFTTTLTIGEGLFAEESSIKIEGVASGERKTKRIGPGSIGYAGDFTYKITDYAASYSFKITPKEAASSEFTEFPDGRSVRIDSLSFEPALFYTTDSESGTQRLLGKHDHVLALVSATVKNQADESLDAPYLGIKDGEAVTELPEYGVGLSAISGLPGQPLASASVDPGSSVSGVYLYQLPYPTARESLELQWQRNNTDTPPEITWPLEPETGSQRALPEFRLESLNAPDTAFIGEEFSVKASVSNIGEVAGTFRGELQYTRQDDDEFTSITTVSDNLTPGESAEINVPIWEESTGSETVRLAPFISSTSIKYSYPQLPVGDSFQTPWVSFTVTDVVDPDVTEYDYTVDGSGSSEYAVLDRKVVFAHVKATNTADSQFSLPSYSDFYLHAEDSEYTGNNPWTNGRPKLVKPVSGWMWRHPGETEPDETYSGWIPFQVPKTVRKSDVTIEASIYYSEFESINPKWSV